MNITGIWDVIVSAKASIFTALACIALCLPLGYCKGYSAATDKAEAERALANVAALKTAVTTNDVAATERVADAINNARTEGALTDAIATTPDTAPDDVRVALGCAQLRNAGTDTAHLPAICGPTGGDGSKAPTNP